MLGAEHPNTLKIESNLALFLSNQGKLAEAEQLLQATLASCHHVLGPTNPTTLETARCLECICPRPAGASTARPLPAGTRVLVQRLVTKPEYNSQRARVLSFDTRTGRYGVVLDDGKELLPKVECVRQAGCATVSAAAGCASEEASSVCVAVCAVPCRAVLLARMPARGLEGIQAGVPGTMRCGTILVVGSRCSASAPQFF